MKSAGAAFNNERVVLSKQRNGGMRIKSTAFAIRVKDLVW